MRARQNIPTLTILAGVGLVVAGAYKAFPGSFNAVAGIAGLVLLLVGGIVSLRSARASRRDLGTATGVQYGDMGAGSPGDHIGHHSSFDGGGFGGGHGGGHGH